MKPPTVPTSPTTQSLTRRLAGPGHLRQQLRYSATLHAAARGAGRRDTGATTLEMVLMAPALIGLLVLVIAAGRVGGANNTVDAAAYSAARAASISRSAPAARAAAYAAANTELTQQGVTCDGLQVNVDTSQFAVPAGQPAQVTADVTCPVPLGDLGLPSLTGTSNVHGRAVSSIDTYRARQP